MTPRVATHIEEFKTETANLHGHEVRVVTYKLGNRHFCLIENEEAGATICRAAGYSAGEARMEALKTADNLVAKAKQPDPAPQPRPVCIDRIVMQLNGESTPMSIEEFLILSLRERMQSILAGKMTFLDSSGNPIPSGRAIEAISMASMR